MKSIIEFINEALDTYTINGIKVKENEWIWIQDPKNDDDDICVRFYFIEAGKIAYYDEKGRVCKVPVGSFIETDKMAQKREKAEMKGTKKTDNVNKLKKQLLDCQKELEEISREMESDPEAIAAAQRGDEAVEYSNRMDKVYKKMEKLRKKIDDIEHPGMEIRWKDAKSYLKENPKEGEDYEWVPKKD